VRRRSGAYALPLHWVLPTDRADAAAMQAAHPRCLDCHKWPPPKWTPSHVATQAAEAGLQGEEAPPLDEVPLLLLRAKVDGVALLNLTSPARLRALGVPRQADGLLLPWVPPRRVETVARLRTSSSARGTPSGQGQGQGGLHAHLHGRHACACPPHMWGAH